MALSCSTEFTLEFYRVYTQKDLKKKISNKTFHSLDTWWCWFSSCRCPAWVGYGKPTCFAWRKVSSWYCKNDFLLAMWLMGWLRPASCLVLVSRAENLLPLNNFSPRFTSPLQLSLLKKKKGKCSPSLSISPGLGYLKEFSANKQYGRFLLSSTLPQSLLCLPGDPCRYTQSPTFPSSHFQRTW